MEEQAANLLLHAKRHLYGDGMPSPNPLHAFRVLEVIVAMFPRTDAAQEAATMLHNLDLSPTDDSIVT